MKSDTPEFVQSTILRKKNVQVLMSGLKKINEPIRDEMKEFSKFFKSSMKSNVALLNIITTYILKTKGKQMRPMLVFLSAKLCGTIGEQTNVAAVLIELLHTASLVHDDVVDETYERRGMFSINALWKNKISILIGDYLLSKGLLLSVDNKSFELLGIVSEAVKDMSEGELLQIEKSRKLNTEEDVYFEIIRKKTAALIAACTAAGAQSVGADAKTVQLLKDFGTHLGIAFQIKDDLFDYQPKGVIGKPTGNDIKEKKLTIPLIYVLNSVSDKERKKILSKIHKHHNNPEKVVEIMNLVKEKGGIEYGFKKMEEYKNKALEILRQFPESEVQSSLIELVEFTVTRNK